jgi:proteasome lid subunit RPN8/RPN11
MELHPAARDDVVAHARAGAPEEVVGVLVGERGPPDRVRRIERATNAATTPETRYELAPAEQLSLLESVESAGDEVVGFYHSHPNGPAEPSATDAARATWNGYLYAIVSLADEPSLGAWRWTGEAFEPVEVTVTGEPGGREQEKE